MADIKPSETDLLTLVSTIGQKGPSSFIFAPASSSNLTNEDILIFRKNLHLTTREFSDLFDFSPATINRIENKNIPGKDSLKRLEIYIKFPEIALYEAEKNKHKINEQKFNFVEKYLISKNHMNSNKPMETSLARSSNKK